MNKVLPVCAATLFLIAVSSVPRFAAAAAPGPAGAAQPQVQPAAKPLVKPPARTQTQTQAAPTATQKATIKALPHVRKISTMQQKPVLANVDLRPDVVGTLQTEPSIPFMGTYNSHNNMGKPLKVTAMVENSGATKADKVAILVIFSRMPTTGGDPWFGQSTWEYPYTADLGPGEAVSYPFDVNFSSGMWVFTVKAAFAGDEKNKMNNDSQRWVGFAGP